MRRAGEAFESVGALIRAMRQIIYAHRCPRRRDDGQRKVRGQDLAERIGLTPANLSKLETGKIKAIASRRSRRELDCQPGDALEYVEEPDSPAT